MNQLIRRYCADQEIHVVLDNLSTRSGSGGTCLARRPNVLFHLTPAGASRLNQIVVRFSILTEMVLRKASFPSAKEFGAARERFTRARCVACSPFAWMKLDVRRVTLRRLDGDGGTQVSGGLFAVVDRLTDADALKSALDRITEAMVP